ncbi:transposase domain-containing protein [Streptomyces sp. NPDC055085]
MDVRLRGVEGLGLGDLTEVFPASLVDVVVGKAGVRERRRRLLPARLMVYFMWVGLCSAPTPTERCCASWCIPCGVRAGGRVGGFRTRPRPSGPGSGWVRNHSESCLRRSVQWPMRPRLGRSGADCG